MNKSEEQLAISSDTETEQVVEDEVIDEEIPKSEVAEEELPESDVIDEEVIPEVEEEPVTEEEVKEEEIVKEPEKEKPKEAVKPKVETTELDIDKSFFPETKVYTDEQYKRDYKEAYDAGDIDKMADAGIKLSESKALEKARYVEQVTSLKTQIKDVETDYPEEYEKHKDDFIKWLRNPNITMKDNFEMFLKKTGKTDNKPKTQSDNTFKTMGRINRNLARKGSLASQRGKVQKASITEKSKEQLQAEEDTGEKFGD